MKKRQFFYPGAVGGGDGMLHRRVAPIYARPVFGSGILGVMNEEIGPGEKLLDGQILFNSHLFPFKGHRLVVIGVVRVGDEQIAERLGVVAGADRFAIISKTVSQGGNRVIEQFSPLQNVVEQESSKTNGLPIDLNRPLREVRDEFERLYFEYHIKKTDKNMSRVAEAAELERTHLYRKLKQLGIKIK